MRNKQKRIYVNDDNCCNNCILCCIPAILLTEFFYKLCSCFSTSSTKIGIRKLN